MSHVIVLLIKHLDTFINFLTGVVTGNVCFFHQYFKGMQERGAVI